MKKILIPVLIIAFLFASCSAKNAVSESTTLKEENIFDNGAYSFLDSENNPVILNESPKSVIAFDSSLAELWIQSGGKLTATSNETANRGITNEVKVINNENEITALGCDFLILSKNDKNYINFAEKNSINYAVFSINSFEDYLTYLKVFTDVNNKPNLYEYYGKEQKKNIADIDAICKEKEKITVCLLDSNGDIVEKDNFVFSILQSVAYPSDEESAEVIFALPGYDDKTNTIVVLPDELFSFEPNSRFAEAYNYIANILYNLNDAS